MSSIGPEFTLADEGEDLSAEGKAQLVSDLAPQEQNKPRVAVDPESSANDK